MSKDNICTSIEQSTKLLELGLSPGTADMRYKSYTSSLDYQTKHCEIPSVGIPQSKDIPAWSLPALWSLMPLTVKKDGVEYCQDVGIGGNGAYSFMYINPSRDSDEVGYWLACKSCDSAIDAAFEMICWLLEEQKRRREKWVL